MLSGCSAGRSTIPAGSSFSALRSGARPGMTVLMGPARLWDLLLLRVGMRPEHDAFMYSILLVRG